MKVYSKKCYDDYDDYVIAPSNEKALQLNSKKE